MKRATLRILHVQYLLWTLTLLPYWLQGQVLFTEDFDTDHTANWAVNASAGTHPVNVFFDYSTIGIPAAPNSGGTTRGLKLQANTVGNVLGGVSVSPLGQSFTGNYQLRFDLWMNYNGPLNGGGNGTTQFGGAGIGVTGTTPQWSGAAALEGVWFAWTGEGGTTLDYRAYSAISNNYVPASGVYHAGTGTSPDARNNTHPYYSSFTGQNAPGAQLVLHPQQTGSTPIGTIGFAWRSVVIRKVGNSVSWSLDGVPFATVDASSFSLSTNIMLNYFDFNAASSTDPNAPALLFALFDNIRVEVVPALFTVTGGGTACSGGPGVPMGLSGSETGVDYLLRTNGVYAGVTVAGTGAALSFGNQTTPANYSVLASNTASTATLLMTGTASVSVAAPPAILLEPTSQVACTGSTILWNVAATGTSPTFQWRRNGSNLANGVTGNGSTISGATSDTLVITAVAPTDAADATTGYDCIITVACVGASTTNSARVALIVNPSPAIFSMTGGGSHCASDPGVAVGLAGSDDGVDYQLFRNGTSVGSPVAGTGAALDFGLQTLGGTYSVQASNSSCSLSMSGSAVVISLESPTIVSGPTPASATNLATTSRSFSVIGSGAALSYQWRRDGTNLTDGGNISGAMTATLNLSALDVTDSVGVGHGYDCVISGSCAPPAVSGEATLSIIPYVAQTNFLRLKAFGFPEYAGLNPGSEASSIEGSDGRLYGTTSYGGSDGLGNIYRVNKDGTDYHVLREFRAGGSDGNYPAAGVTEGSDGAFYGTTFGGGSNGVGTVFTINKDGSGYRLLRHLSTADAAYANSDLLEASDGALYGTCSGGTDGVGAVFRILKDGSGLTVLRSFSSTGGDGRNPTGRLLEGVDGMLYGTTGSGGSAADGTIFKLQKDGTGYAILRNFGLVAGDGRLPSAGLLQGSDGRLYGTTTFGGASDAGSVYTITTNGGGFVILRSFSFSGGSPQTPRSELLEGSDGALYGTTPTGGSSGPGTVFKLNKDGTGYAVLRNFSNSGGDGGYPTPALVEGNDGALYGVTEQGGRRGNGTIFKLNKDGSGYAVVFGFDYTGGDGAAPAAPLIEATDGALYGTTTYGGSNGYGAVFRLEKNGTGYTLIHTFDGTPNTSGETPAAGVIEGSDGFLYGTAESGGSSGGGTIFKLSKSGSGFTVLRSFSTSGGSGQNPVCGLVEASDGALYGTTKNGGSSGQGIIFKLNKDGTAYSVLRSFSNTGGDGMNPAAGLLIASDNSLYGTTINGGDGGVGTVFKINQNGSGYAVVRSFSASGGDGRNPSAALMETADGTLYGTTQYGGSSLGGTVFKIQKDGSGYAVLRHFGPGGSGRYPLAGLVEGPDGALYGTTSEEGAGAGGTAFRMNGNGSGFLVLRSFDFSGPDGANPLARLLVASDGALYGTTERGGRMMANFGFGQGTIFKISSAATPPAILAQPRSRTNITGASVWFTVTALGTEPLSYQWQHNEADINGATAADLSIEGIQQSDAGNYRVIITNYAGSITSGFAMLQILNRSPIIANPIPDQTNAYGSALNFTFAAATFSDPDAGQTLSFTASNLPPGISFDGPTRTFSGTLTNVGTFTIIVSATDNGTPALSTNDVFDLVVGKAPLLATAEDKSRSYGAANPALTIAYSGFVLGETAAVLGLPPAVGTVADPASPVGNYPITLTGGADAHYDLTLSNGTLTVLSAALVVSADNTNRSYGQPNPTFTGSLTGIQNGDNLGATYSTTATLASMPGNYPITPELLDPDNKLGNYTVTTNSGTLTVDCLGSVTVTSSADHGAGSLREALTLVCPDGTIDFAVTGAIALTSGNLVVTQSVNLIGPGATNLTISGSQNSRVFRLTAGTNLISGLTIAHGRSLDDETPPNRSGGIMNEATLTLDSCIVASNVAGLFAGGLGNLSSATLTVRNSLFLGNETGNDGGALVNNGIARLTNSTFSANTSQYDAGGIYNSGDMVIESCTLTANRAGNCSAGCIGLAGGLNNDTQSGATLLLHNSIVAGNTNWGGGSHDIEGAITAGDYNLVGYTNSLSLPGTHNVPGLPALLGPLADNGGPVFTHLPLPGSPAIDAGDPASELPADQRGVSRPQNGRADIGAVEVEPTLTPPTLFIAGAGSASVTISWTPPTPGFALQTNLTLNPATWGDAASGSTNPTVVPVTNGAVFFRLKN